MSLAICSPSKTPKHPSTLFPEISRCRTLRDLNQIHGELIKTGRIQDPLAAAEILKLSAVSDFRDLVYARRVFDEMTERNCFSYNTMIRAMVEDGEGLEAVVVFRKMMDEGVVEPNRFTFPSVLKGCAESGSVEEGKQVHGLVLKMGLECDEFVVSNLVRMYANCGVMKDACKLFDRIVGKGEEKSGSNGSVVLWNVMVGGYVSVGELEAARKLFDRMSDRSIVSWNGIISGYAQNGCFKEALEVFSEMQVAAGVYPNYVTLVSVLPAISGLGALDLGTWVHLYSERNGINVDEVLGSALVDMYSKCGSIEKAIQLFDSLPQKNVITWNSLIVGLAMHGQGMEALDYFVKMELAGVSPTDVTYIGLLTACSHAGLVSKGKSLFNLMTEVHRLKPRVEHYTCMVDLLGRAGLLTEAKDLILNMPIKPDDVIWKALLGACKTHGNVEIGERVAQKLMELAPYDSGSYVALSNMYASTGYWNQVAEVRLKMKTLDIRKDPGCSWIELDGELHEFLAEDDVHCKAKEIRSMLLEISSTLKRAGYKPDTSNMLLRMDEEVKESSVHYHSEKIAVAFGLISTSSETVLRIVKNLRICNECHSSMKLISKVYKRRIVVRDRKRFHHFENGSCSCMDYCEPPNSQNSIRTKSSENQSDRRASMVTSSFSPILQSPAASLAFHHSELRRRELILPLRPKLGGLRSVGIRKDGSRLRCNCSLTPGGGSGSGDNESKNVLDAFFLGKAVAEALNERIESAVGEILSTVGRLQAEQQKQVQEFQDEVLERAKRAKEKAAREAKEAQGLPIKSTTPNVAQASSTSATSPASGSGSSTTTVKPNKADSGSGKDDAVIGFSNNL